ncbi:hypothetical protein CHUAL_008365 [Chamberlinius hualienensis]
MKSVKIIAILGLLLFAFNAQIDVTRAFPISLMKKSGISDQRLAELETLITLGSMRSRAGGSRVAFGIIDPSRIGKRFVADFSN